MVRFADIEDGSSQTYLLGEKNIDPQHYRDGVDQGDDQLLWVGHDRDIVRWTDLPPKQDTPGVSYTWNFGSSHSTGCYFAFCDGSVRLIHYNIDKETHRRLGNRQDGLVVELKGF